MSTSFATSSSFAFGWERSLGTRLGKHVGIADKYMVKMKSMVIFIMNDDTAVDYDDNACC